MSLQSFERKSTAHDTTSLGVVAVGGRACDHHSMWRWLHQLVGRIFGTGLGWVGSQSQGTFWRGCIHLNTHTGASGIHNASCLLLAGIASKERFLLSRTTSSTNPATSLLIAQIASFRANHSESAILHASNMNRWICWGELFLPIMLQTFWRSLL